MQFLKSVFFSYSQSVEFVSMDHDFDVMNLWKINPFWVAASGSIWN